MEKDVWIETGLQLEMLDLSPFLKWGLISENWSLEEINRLLAFKIYINISSYPYESVDLREWVVSSISLLDTNFNLREGNDWLHWIGSVMDSYQ